VYRLRGIPQLSYSFSINGKYVKRDIGVGAEDMPGGFGGVGLDSIRNRRFVVKAFCQDPEFHRILWNTVVPEKVYVVPYEGWKKPPFTILED
jgi:hypothetical protein